MSPKVHGVSDEDALDLTSRLGRQAARLLSVEVRLDPRTNASIVATIEDSQAPEPYYLLMSPPAAIQLSHSLQRAVDDYLSQSAGTE